MMRKYCYVALVALMLTSCGSVETFETIADEPVLAASAEERQIVVTLPEDASVMTIQGEAGTIYLCDGYEISLETLSSGDLDRTIRTVTGYHQENLTVMETQTDGITRHDLVWCAAGENGDRLGRAAILDDGSYHYALSVMADAENASSLATQWDALFASYGLD